MTFDEIIQPLIYGKKVRRTSWNDGVYIMSNGDKVWGMTDIGGKYASFCFTDKCFSLDDITADDWELYR